VRGSNSRSGPLRGVIPRHRLKRGPRPEAPGGVAVDPGSLFGPARLIFPFLHERPLTPRGSIFVPWTVA
jgi:hypothetical protein